MATVATISVNFAQYDSTSFTSTGVSDRSINPKTLSQYCLGSLTGDLSYLGGFVKKTGDSMSGYLTLPTANPIDQNHATRKGYVDSRISSLSATIGDPNNGGFVKLSGSTMSGNLILNTSIPTVSLQASSKGYVDTRVASLSDTVNFKLNGEYLAKSGGSMSGPIGMGGNKITGLPISVGTTFIDSDAVSKKYVDTAVSFATNDGATVTYVNQQNALKVSKSGDSMSGTLTIAGSTGIIGVNTGYTGASIDVQASGSGIDSNAAYITFHRPSKYAVRFGLDTDNVLKVGGWSMGNVAYPIITSNNIANYAPTATDVNGKVSKYGDTMTGALTLPAVDPTNDNQATRKKYVDDSIATAIGTATGAATTAAGKVSKTGDTMTGALILPAVDPTNANHATRKDYVDTKVTAASNAAAAAQTTANNAATAAANANTNANNRVLRSGDTMTGSLTVQGNITATGDVTAYSDSRLKKNINLIDDALNKVLKLKGVTFEKISDGKKSLGVIAQDVMEVIPEVVLEGNDGHFSVAYGNIVGVLIEAIKELNTKVEKLENQLNK